MGWQAHYLHARAREHALAAGLGGEAERVAAGGGGEEPLELSLGEQLKMAGLLRVPPEVEEAGMDISKHGGTAYEKQVVS